MEVLSPVTLPTLPSFLLPSHFPSDVCVPVPDGILLKEITHKSKGTKAKREKVTTGNKGTATTQGGSWLCQEGYKLREWGGRTGSPARTGTCHIGDRKHEPRRSFLSYGLHIALELQALLCGNHGLWEYLTRLPWILGHRSGKARKILPKEYQ